MLAEAPILESNSLLAIIDYHDHNAPVGWGKVCAYCRSSMKQGRFDDRFSHGYYDKKLDHCERCGWWSFDEQWDSCNTLHYAYFCSILQRFDIRAASVPVEILELEIPKWIDRIYDLNPKRMEDLIKRVLARVWDCEVRHMGYSKDGGTDLIILDGDQPVAVQIKRRESPKHRELVSCIREFLGAALLEDHRRLMYVTTAEGFTRGAVEAARRSEEKKLVEAFELVSMDGIRSFLPALPNQTPWDFALGRHQADRYETPNIPNPYELASMV
jgi:restriction system protein